jgi:GDP-L-fucose synthase
LSIKKFYQKKTILVAGGTGLVGTQLIEILSGFGSKVISVSLDKIKYNFHNVKFVKSDLRYLDNCINLTKNVDIIINLAGVAGSPKITKIKPRSIFVPNILFGINLLEAAIKNKVKTFVYASSYGVYSPNNEMREDKMWEYNLSPHDQFGGWAKRTVELHIKSVKAEYNGMFLPIIRPGNIYGPYGNFDIKNAMVVTSLINKITSGLKEVKILGDGTQKRDFVFSADVANCIIEILYKRLDDVYNIGTGKGTTIRELAETIKEVSKSNSKLVYDNSKKTGDQNRILNVEKINKEKIFCNTSLKEGLKLTINWYLQNKLFYKKRFNSFNEK